MGSQHTRMEQAADRRLDREQRTERKHSTMNAIRTHRVELHDDDEDVPVFPPDVWPRVEVLGQAPRGNTFVSFDGREFELRGRVHEAEQNNPRLPGEYYFERDEQRIVPGQGAWRDRYFISAIEHEPGEYARRCRMAEIVAQRKASRQAAPAPHLFDVADLHPILDGRPGSTVVLEPSDPHALDDASNAGDIAVELARGFYSQRGSRLAREATPPVRGIEALAQWLTDRGVTVVVEDGVPLVLAPLMSPEIAGVIAAIGPLLVGRAMGSPIPCALRHTTPVAAWTIAVGGPAVCREHLDGAL